MAGAGLVGWQATGDRYLEGRRGRERGSERDMARKEDDGQGKINAYDIAATTSR